VLRLCRKIPFLLVGQNAGSDQRHGLLLGSELFRPDEIDRQSLRILVRLTVNHFAKSIYGPVSPSLTFVLRKHLSYENSTGICVLYARQSDRQASPLFEQFESAGRIGSILLYEFESVVESYDNRGIRRLAWG